MKKESTCKHQESKTRLAFPGELVKMRATIICFLILFISSIFSQNEKSSFIPGKLPDGFTFAQTPEYYGTYEQPQKNGTIFDFIDGGGEVYIKHGFRSVSHIILENKAKDTITLDIYDLGSPGNTTAAFADETICPSGFSEKKIGTSNSSAKTYHYEPDFLVYFIKGKYLIYLGLSNDALAETLIGFAAEIYNDIK